MWYSIFNPSPFNSAINQSMFQLTNKPINWQVNQPMCQSIMSINQCVNLISINESTNVPISIQKSIIQSIYQSTNVSINQCVNQSWQSINVSTNQCVNQSMYQTINVSINQQVNQSRCQFINLSINQYVQHCLTLLSHCFQHGFLPCLLFFLGLCKKLSLLLLSFLSLLAYPIVRENY